MNTVAPYAGNQLMVSDTGVPPKNNKLCDVKVRWWLGMLYVATTLYGSVSFLESARTVLVNDIFWSCFNATSGGVFVANSFNSFAWGTSNATTTQLTDPAFARILAVSSEDSRIAFSSHCARQLQYDRLTTIEDGIKGLRTLDGYQAPVVFTQYCWLDFDRRWSLAHTHTRAERCWHDHASNAAVYMESVLRNVDWADFQQMWGRYFAVGIAIPLMEMEGGAAFLDDVKRNRSVALPDEVWYWQSKGVTHYTLQYHNLWQLGVDEKISIVNAFGVQTLFSIKKNEYVDRWAVETTMKMYWSLVNDFWAVVDNNTRISGMSLIRNSSNFYGNHNISMERLLVEDSRLPDKFTPNQNLFRAAVGPYGSVDMIWTMFPAELAELAHKTKAIVMEAALQSPDSRAAFVGVSANAVLTLSPRVWNDGGWIFTSGNPLCTAEFTAHYVLQQFAFDDGCQPLADDLNTDPFRFVFAALVTEAFDGNNTDDVCASGTLDLDLCVGSFNQAFQFIRDFIPMKIQLVVKRMARAVHASIVTLNVSMIQFALRGDVDNPDDQQYVMLTEPVLSADNAAPWNAFGWCLMLDWIQGIREVVSFQGDHSKLTILSSQTPQLNIAANTVEISTSTAFYLQLSMLYVTVVLVGVAMTVLIYGMVDGFHVAGSNLFKFNRVVGIVWVGRPLLFLRGMVAICMLSTARPELVVDNQLLWMEDTSRSWISNLLTASEATWLLYIALDLLLALLRGQMHYLALTSNIVTFMAVALLQLLSPTEHTMVVDPACQYVKLDSRISCKQGAVFIGNSTRLITILIITAVGTAGCYVLVRCTSMRRPTGNDCMALPGVAQEIFARDGWVHDGAWHIDRASAAMAGLVSRHAGNKTLVFNIASWSVLEQFRSTTTSEAHLERALCLHKLNSHDKS